MNSKTAFKAFFKTKETSDTTLELLKKFIIPFARELKKTGIDDTLSSFFALEERHICYIRAKRKFNLPGKFYVAGNRPVYGLEPRGIAKGQVMLIAIDRIEGTARIEIGPPDNAKVFLLERFEFETIKDWVDVIE